MLTTYLVGVIITATLMTLLVLWKRKVLRKYTVLQEIGYSAVITICWPFFLCYLIAHKLGLVK